MNAQSSLMDAKLSPTLIFALMQQSYSTKGFISNCYAMLIGEYLESFPSSAGKKWEKDMGAIPGDQLEKALEAV